ncbi:MAG: hypothetical protein ABIO94_07690 [Opitutaceae bacterium]
MPHDPHAQFDHTVLEMIEHSPTGAVPHTPAYVDSLARLYASHQVYADADHKNGHVTVRSLATKPAFFPNNLEDFIAGKIDADALESNASIFHRYVQSLPAAQHARAESFRVMVIGKPAHHRAKHGVAVHDPLHALFLVPGAGPHPGLPGNYLHGAVFHVGADGASGSWAVHLHDSDDGAALYNTPNLSDALEKIQELIASAPFHLSELTDLGFRPN